MSACLKLGRLVAATGIVALAVAAHAASSTQMFKCIVGSRTVYQQQACPIDAEPAPAPGAAAASSAANAASTVADATAARKLKPAARPASSAPATPR